MSISNIVQLLKGYSSRILRQEFQHLTEYVKHLWASGYFCETIGTINQETIIKYIENQKYV